MDRRTFVRIALCGLPAAPSVKAQSPRAKTVRIGYLSSHSAAAGQPYAEAFRQGLRDLGYLEGRNLLIEYRWADGNYDRLPALAKQLVGLNVDMIVSVGGPPTARAAKAATDRIPIVFVSGGALQAGIVSSLARPGGNVTGLEVLAEELDSKRLELLKEMIPKLTRVAVLWNSGTPEGEVQRQRLDAAALAMRVRLGFVGARHPGELQRVFADIERERYDALLVSTDPMYSSEAARIVSWAARVRLPAIYFSSSFSDGLMIYGPDFAAIHRHAATYVDKIVNGAKPADLPVEQPTKFHLVINLKAANAAGISIPQSLLLRANEVVE